MPVGYVLDELDYARAMNRGDVEGLVQPFGDVCGAAFERILMDHFQDGELWRVARIIGSEDLLFPNSCALLLEEGERAAWVGVSVYFVSGELARQDLAVLPIQRGGILDPAKLRVYTDVSHRNWLPYPHRRGNEIFVKTNVDLVRVRPVPHDSTAA